MKILITGAAGFVASHIIEFLNKNHDEYKIVGIDNLSYGYKERLDNLSLYFIESDLNNIDKIKMENVNAIIHTAAIAPLPDNEIDPSKSYTENVVNTIRVAEYATKIGCKKIIFLSSGAIYENDATFPSKEREHLKTSLVYPTTKMCAEHALGAYSRSYGISTYALRLFNLYGPRQDYFRKHPPLIGYLLKCIFNDEVATLYSDGHQKRDYVFINDLAKVIINLLEIDDKKIGITPLNIGSGVATSVNEIVDVLNKISQKELIIKRNHSSDFWKKYESIFTKKMSLNLNILDKEVNKYTLSENTNLHNITNLKCTTSIEDGLRECYDYAKRYFQK